MPTNTNKLTISGFAEMARSVQTYVSGQLQNIDFSGLQDTPSGYLGHSGDYLVVNDGESGIHFTGIEKIAQDLTDYGFSAGATSHFTGLQDTPDSYQSGYFVKSTSSGIEYSDQVVFQLDVLPTDVVEGKLIEVDCVLYMGCNNSWVDISKINDSTDEPPQAVEPIFTPPTSTDECSLGTATALYPNEAIYNNEICHYSNYNFTTLITHRGSLSYYAFYDDVTHTWEYQGYWPVNHKIMNPSFSANGKIVAYQNTTISDSNFYVYQYKESSKQWVQLGSTINNAGWNTRNDGYIDGPWEFGFTINLEGNKVTWIKEVRYWDGSTPYCDLIIKSAIWNGVNWEMLPDFYIHEYTPGTQVIAPDFSPTRPYDSKASVQWSEDGNTLLYFDKRGSSQWAIGTRTEGNTWEFENLNIGWTDYLWAQPSLSKNGKHIGVINQNSNTRDVYAKFISKINGTWTLKSERFFTHPKNNEIGEIYRSPSRQIYISDDGNSFVIYISWKINSSTYTRRETLFVWDEAQFPDPGWIQVAEGVHLSPSSKPGESIGCYTSNLSRFLRSATHFVLDGACAQEYLSKQTEISSTTTSFVDLQDVPDTLEGAANSIVKVNSESDGLEFQDAQNLTEQISQTIVNDDLIVLDTDYSFQTKYLTGSINSNGGIEDLEFNDLTVGDTYRLSSTVSINSDGTASDKIKVNYYHGGNKIAAVYSDNISQSVSTSILFSATSNSLLVSGQNLDANNYIEGSPNEITFTQIEKISNNIIAPEIISVTDGSTQTFDGATMADNNYIKIEGDNVSATIEIDTDSFVVAQSGEQMIWDQGGVGETVLNLGESINVTLSNGRVVEIKFYRSGSLYFAINKKSEPTIQPSPTPTPTVTITVTPTPSITPTVTPTSSVSAAPTGEYFDRFNSNEEMFLPITLE